jgi:transposase
LLGVVELGESERAELLAMLNSTTVTARVATRARIVLWRSDGCLKKEVAVRAGVSRPTVDAVLRRFALDGVAGLLDRPVTIVRPARVPPEVRARILAVTRSSPPAETGLSHWSSRELAALLKRTEGVCVSHNYIAALWREHGLKPWRLGTFKLSRDPAFAEKVADVVGLYLQPPGGAVVLSIDEKTQIQALDRTQPTLPLDCGKAEKRTHDYVRHGTTNLFAALNVGTGEVFGECRPTRNGQDFLDFLKKAVRPHAGKEIRVVLDNLSTHTTPEVLEWLEKNPQVRFHFTPVGSSWLNQIEIWFGVITRQSIRRGTFTSVRTLIAQITEYINTWNANPRPFTWVATVDEILAKVKVVEANVRKLVDNNAK